MDLSVTRSIASPELAPRLVESLEKLLARRGVAIAINLAALILLAASLAHWTWRIWQPSAPEVARPVAGAPSNGGELDLTALLNAHLFGTAAPATESRVALENIPLSSLNLVLTGVMVTPAGSFALISANGGPETAFGLNEEIVSGASLYAVYADRALIRRGAATESLMLKDSTPALPGGAIVMPAERSGPAQNAANIQKTGSNSYTVDREMMNRQMQKPEFLSQALMVPNAGGGFLVREVQAGSLYEKLGLRVGDVIRSVNGQVVNTVEDVMKLYQQLGGGEAVQVNLEVRRAGKSETLHYNLQ